MRRDLVISRLGHDYQRAAAFGILDGELEQHHGGITMSHKINLLQPQAIEYAQQFPRAFRRPDKTRTIFLPSIHNDAPRLAESSYLARIHPLEVFEDRHKHQRLALANINERHINISYRKTPPQRLDILYVGVKYSFINQGTTGSRGLHDAPLTKRWTQLVELVYDMALLIIQHRI